MSSHDARSKARTMHFLAMRHKEARRELEEALAFALTGAEWPGWTFLDRGRFPPVVQSDLESRASDEMQAKFESCLSTIEKGGDVHPIRCFSLDRCRVLVDAGADWSAEAGSKLADAARKILRRRDVSAGALFRTPTMDAESPPRARMGLEVSWSYSKDATIADCATVLRELGESKVLEAPALEALAQVGKTFEAIRFEAAST